jgi:hypothetical protein
MSGDWIQIDYDGESNRLVFTKEAEGLEVSAMANLLADTVEMPPLAAAASVSQEHTKIQLAKTSKKS